MEKFELLNLLKAIDGLNNVPTDEKEQPSPPSSPSQNPPESVGGEMPNIMYEALLRHETTSNRIKNKK